MTIDKLEEYFSLLRHWCNSINLAGKSMLDPESLSLCARQVQQSCEIIRTQMGIANLDGVRVLDMGSGGGIWGLTWSILNPSCIVCLTESRARKAAFLYDAKRLLDLRNVEVYDQRIEKINSLDVDIATTRAFGSLAHAIQLGSLHLKPSGYFGMFMSIKPNGIDMHNAVHQPSVHELEKGYIFMCKIALPNRHLKG